MGKLMKADKSHRPVVKPVCHLFALWVLWERPEHLSFFERAEIAQAGPIGVVVPGHARFLTIGITHALKNPGVAEQTLEVDKQLHAKAETEDSQVHSLEEI